MEKITEKFIQAKGRTIPIRRVQLICEDESLTKTAFTKASDIRNIIAQALKVGALPAPRSTALYGDFTNSKDFLTQLNRVSDFKSNFDRLDPKIRERFGNNPANLIDFISDPENHAEAVRLGVMEAPPEPEVIPDPDKPAPLAPVVPPAQK